MLALEGGKFSDVFIPSSWLQCEVDLMFGEDNQCILNFEAIHPEVLRYFEHIFCALFNKGGESNTRMVHTELAFIEDSIGVKRGTIYGSMQRHARDDYRQMQIYEMQSKIAEMQQVVNS